MYKLLKEILKAGFITAEQKEKLEKMYKDASEEIKKEFKEDYEKAISLEVKGDEDDEGGEDVDEEVKKQIKTLISQVKSEVSTEVKEDLQKKFEEFLKETERLKSQKIGVYNEEVQKDKKRKEINKWLREFGKALNEGDHITLKKIQGRGMSEEALKKELSTDATGSPYGGYVVDTELSAEIRHLQTQYGVARREMTTLQLSKNSLKANNLATDVTVNWEDEAGAINSTQVVLGQGSLELKKLAAIVALTSELIEDEEIDLFSFIATRVAEAFAQKEDEAYFKGDGTDTYGGFTGLLNNGSVNEVTMAGTTFASIDADDLIDMVDATPQGALGNAKFYMHRTIMSYIRKLKDSQNQYIYQAPADKGPATVWGYPVVLVEAMPSKSDSAAGTSFVLFGDLKKACILGYKGAIRAKRFDAGIVRNVADNADINLITTDREAIRWTQRTGFLTILPSAVTKLTTKAASA